MLFKFYIFISFILLNIIILCGADEKVEETNTTDHVTNSSQSFNGTKKKLKKFINNVLYDLKANETANRRKLDGHEGRFLTEYFVFTCCGHVLSTFRLTSKVESKKCPVLLVHGLFQSSDSFFVQDKEQSLALKLQDLGYDVWLANMRANKYNREHMVLAPETNDDDKKEFLNYNYEDLATRDIADTVDFILKITEYEKLIYIGHSLGGTTFLVLNSLKPEYNSKFSIAFLFAPFGYQDNFPNYVLKKKANGVVEIHEALLNKEISEIFPYKSDDAKFSPEDCLGIKEYSTICDQLNIQKIMGLKSTNNNVNETRGGSIGPLIHLGQNIRSGNFSRWDYGEQENLKRYQTSTPPKYNLRLVTVPTHIIYATNDEFVSPKDIANMANEMKNVKLRQVKRRSFTHEDFITGSNAMKNVYAGIIDELNRNKNICPDGENRGFLFYLNKYKWIWGSILLIILLTGIAIWLMQCNRRMHQKKHFIVVE